ncbi:MAG: hypothetical protein KF813_09420 [Trueperaceae bacterium]|nr:hypothetical protein [Trueperaceae bacterium]
MSGALRIALLVACGVLVLLAVAFFLRLPFAVDLWPFPGTTPLTYVFVASILLAAAASTLWTILTKNYGALAGIALDMIAILGPVGVLALRLGDGGATGFGIGCLLIAAAGVPMLIWSLRLPLDATNRTPRLVLWSMAAFVAALVYVAYHLIDRQPNVIFWSITPELSLVMGFTFLGAALYFAYGLVRPYWSNAGGQLAGFLAYDLVLIVPFLQRFSTVTAENRISHLVYTAVVVVSGALAAYYLFIAPTTRLRAQRN